MCVGRRNEVSEISSSFLFGRRYSGYKKYSRTLAFVCIVCISLIRFRSGFIEFRIVW